MKKIIVAVAALALMAGSAYAADWNFYGSARVSTFWTDVDVDGADDPDTQYDQALQSNARIGATVKVSDELTGRFEYGAKEGDANIRLLYGEWNFGAGKLLVGQDYTPMYLPASNQVYSTDNALDGWGNVNGNLRKAQIKLTFGDFQIAFVENDTNYVNGNWVAQTVSDATTNGVDVIMPMIQVRYGLTIQNFVITMAGGYQTFDVEDKTKNVDDDVTSWGLGLDVDATFGAFKASAQVNGGTNVGNIYKIDTAGIHDQVAAGISNDVGAGYAMVGTDATGTKVLDNDAIGFTLTLGYTFNEMFGVEVGYGYQQTEYDYSGADELEVESYYIQFPITLASGVYVVPEVGIVDYTKDDMDGQEDITYFGAKWQINF